MTVARRKQAHPRARAENPHDALVLLTTDHREVEKLGREFDRLRKAGDPVEKGKAALRLCHVFERYAHVKREVFYPAAAAVLEGEERDLLAKAEVVHEAIDDLIEKIKKTPAEDPSFDAVVLVMAEQCRGLMKQEERDLFPRLRHSRLDLQGTGERMAARRAQLGTAPLDRVAIRHARIVMGERD